MNWLAVLVNVTTAACEDAAAASMAPKTNTAGFFMLCLLLLHRRLAESTENRKLVFRAIHKPPLLRSRCSGHASVSYLGGTLHLYARRGPNVRPALRLRVLV